MAGIARSIRFLVGVAMVAGGATLAAPVVTRAVTLAAAQWSRHGGLAQPPAAAPSAGPTAAVEVAVPQPPPPPTLAVGMADPPPFAPPVAADAPASPPGSTLDPDYRPPSPPVPLPGLPAEFLVPGPQVGNAYRSTLDVPPPPLLDSQQSPPLAVARAAHDLSSASPPPPVSDVPQTYRVKDGDDLTSIATRLYGHPGAAAMIWEANRGTITDPSLLPIGAELRLPAAWSAGGPLAGGLAGRAIEPPATTSGDVAAGPRAAPISWLGVGGSPAPSTPGQPVAPPRSVRLAPGETLATLATRFYGDASQANRIWEANRDRLRSPELVVAGMELRLP
ncbi:MAG: LysM peptidoglycan-binding domain-containing protein [Planctomycetaceae bacterium]